MSKRIYIAAPYSRRAELRHLAHYLTHDAAITVTSRWLEGEFEHLDHAPTDADMRQWAKADMQDILAADALVLFAGQPSIRGGCHVEFGYAMAAGKLLIVVERADNIFHALTGVHRFDTWGDARPWLIRWASAEQEAAA